MAGDLLTMPGVQAELCVLLRQSLSCFHRIPILFLQDGWLMSAAPTTGHLSYQDCYNALGAYSCT